MIIKKILMRINPLRVAQLAGMKVGENLSLVSPRSVNFGTEPYLIEIGNNVRISGNVYFLTHDGGTWAFRYKDKYKNIFKYGRIKIGDYTFIGCGATIMPGVSIGKNCVIGARSVVTKSIPNGIVVAGNPAKKICTIEEYAEKCKRTMPQNLDFDLYHKNKKEALCRYY